MTLGGALTGLTAAMTAAVITLTPTVQTVPELLAASVTYLRGTNIGWTPTDAQYRAFIEQVLDGTDTPADPPASTGNIEYNAGFWPVSRGLIFDLTWNRSVAQGVQNVAARNPDGDVIFGLSQGAVVASRYKAANPGGTGNTFVLVENPSRPNGGVLSRFEGLHIPVLDVDFSGPTPDNGDLTIDVARQYDGWADFPTYPLNLLATVNAVMGMIYVHGRTQTELTAADLEAARATGNDTMYYQERGNTTYYLVHTPRLPLLMPLTGIVPEPVLNQLDSTLRPVVEAGYDRTDYSSPTRAGLLSPAQALRNALRRPNAAAATAPKTGSPKARSAARSDGPTRSTAGSARAARGR